MTSSPEDQRERTAHASLGQSFSFEQGSSLHVGLLGYVARASGPHDQDPYAAGTCAGGTSVCHLDLGQLHGEPDLLRQLPDQPDQEAPPLTVWFGADRTVLDLSAAFNGVPTDVLKGSGIPASVLAGPVSIGRSGDAGDGATALLTQACQGRFVLDPAAMLGLISSDKVTGFAESSTKEYLPLRAFNAQMPAACFLDAMGLTSEALINQVAGHGFHLRFDVGESAVDDLNEFLRANQVDVSWFIDDQDRVQTAQVVLTLTDFFGELFRRDEVVEQMAREESCSVAEVIEFVEEMAGKGRLVYLNAAWQTFQYDSTIPAIEWPDAPDITSDVAAQAERLRQASGAVSAPHETAALPANVSIDPDMLDQLAASSGAMHFVLSRVDGDAQAAMAAAQLALRAVRHPDEPTEALASYLSEVILTDTGAQFVADISDMEEETEILAELIAAAAVAISGQVTTAHLSGSVQII